MSTFTGQKIANTYKQLLQVNTSNSDLGSTLITIQTGAGNNTPLQLATDKVNINGTFQLGGETLTANVSALNNIADLSGITGIVVGDSGSLSGRTLVGGSPITITNANGTAGNPTISLETTGITSATYGPLGKFNVDTYGRVIEVTIATTVSANAFVGGTLSGSSLTVENDTSIGGDVVIEGTTNMKAVSATDVTLNNLTVGTKITAETVTATTIETSILRATRASITDLAADSLTFNNVSVSTLNANIINITSSTNLSDNATLNFGDDNDLVIQHNGIHSVIKEQGTGDLFIQSNKIQLTNTGSFSMLTLEDGQDAEFPYGVQVSGTVSATSFIGPTITSINNVIANVSGLTQINLDAITSINTVVAGVSALTKTNLDSITSINSVVANVSSDLATSIANHLPLAGGTMTGNLVLNGSPSTNLQAATKQYVDNLTAAAIHFHDAVRVESPDSAGSLNATYDNGTSGVGATLTNAGTQEALVIDGVTLNTSDRVLIYNQTNAYENGVYTVTDTGSVSTNWVLTRATDADSYEPNDNTGLDGGSYFYVEEGDTGAGEAYVCSNVGTITFGTTGITFTLFSSALVYSAGTGINISGSRVISVSGVPSSAAIAAVSALTQTNLDSITSINSVITSINSATTSINSVITSVNSLAVAVSALTQTNLDAIVSINTVVDNIGGGTTINNNADNRIITGSNTADTLEAESTLTYDGTYLDFADSKKARFGDTNDLEVFHEPGFSIIRENNAQPIFIQTDNTIYGITLSKKFGTETMAQFKPDGAVILYYDNASKLATKSDGVDITGELQCDSLDVDGNADISGTLTMGGNIDLQDSDKILVGTDDDLEIYHFGGISHIENNSPALTIQSNILVLTDANGSISYFQGNSATGEAKVYYNNTEKLTTTSDGVLITGELEATTLDINGNADISGTLTMGGNIDLQDNDKLMLGTGDDLQIYHNGSASIIYDGNATNLILGAVGFTFFNQSFTEVMLSAVQNGAVTLYYDNSAKLATTSTGIDVTGSITATSFSGDGSALTNVSGPTALNAVGTYAFMYVNSVTNPGGTRSQGAHILRYAANNAATTSTIVPSGTWRVMGWLQSDQRATVMVRIA